MRTAVMVLLVIVALSGTVQAENCVLTLPDGRQIGIQCVEVAANIQDVLALQDQIEALQKQVDELRSRVDGVPYAYGLPNLPGRNDLPDMGPARDDLPDMGKK